MSRCKYLDVSPQALSVSLPAFLRPLTRPLQHVEMQLLEQRGAFLIPEPKILSELVDVYFDFVNPFLPLFDECEMPSLVTLKNDGELSSNASGHISLLVLQAMIFSASAVSRCNYGHFHPCL